MFAMRGNVLALAVGVIIGGAPPRMPVTFLEKNLQANGSVVIPKVLQP